MPRGFVINRMDRELANFDKATGIGAAASSDARVVPIQLAYRRGKEFQGVVDLITMKALIYTPDGDGRGKVEEIPADMAEAAKEAHETLVEMVAEGDDALMEEFFEKGTLPVEDLLKGLRGAVQARRIFPVMVSSALHNIGSDAILNTLVQVFPDPAARGKAQRDQRADGKGQPVEREVKDAEPVSIFVFKTLLRSVFRARSAISR